MKNLSRIDTEISRKWRNPIVFRCLLYPKSTKSPSKDKKIAKKRPSSTISFNNINTYIGMMENTSLMIPV